MLLRGSCPVQDSQRSGSLGTVAATGGRILMWSSMNRVGIDAQSVSDVTDALQEFGERYRRRVFTLREYQDCAAPGTVPSRIAEGLAARFAAKEATLKVLRVTERVPPWTDIEVVREPGGWTSLRLSGLAAAIADESGLRDFSVSLSHTAELAVAVVTADEAAAVS
jgi:holo-[acyl-carrier protein] synthase